MMKRHLLFIPIALLLSGCASTLIVDVTPSNAKISVEGTPAATISNVKGKPVVSIPQGSGTHTIVADLDGYDKATHLVSPADLSKGTVSLSLVPLFLDKSFSVSADQPGAEISVDGRTVGTAPMDCSIRFSRKSAKTAWDKHIIKVSKPEWQSESVTVDTSTGSKISVALSRLHLARTFKINTVTSDNQPVDAKVTVAGKVIGNAPVNVDLVFERADKSKEWPTFDCTVGIKDEYKDKTFSIRMDSPDSFTIALDPVTQMGVNPMIPCVGFGPRGAHYSVDNEERIAMVDTRESSGTVVELRQVTTYRRDEHRSPQVNSFAISPNGQSIVYALSEAGDDGVVSSNLWESSTDLTNGARQRLTVGPYLDSLPQLPVCETEDKQLLYFQSNRGVRESADISCITLSEGRAVGGITQITREARYNFGPAIANWNWELFFISTEDHYPQAVPQISYMRSDGSSVSYMNETGTNISLSPDGRVVYFVRKDTTTGKEQIYSMPREGYPLTQVIPQAVFNNSNCNYPAVSPDGTSMLFVSDMAQDESGRHNNDIYLMDFASGQIKPIITNASDDIRPVWSPVEPGIIYFLSNRGGSYNVWRFRLSEIQ